MARDGGGGVVFDKPRDIEAMNLFKDLVMNTLFFIFMSRIPPYDGLIILFY